MIRIDTLVIDLEQWAAEGALGAYEAGIKAEKIIQGIAILRNRIDELGGYHDDV